MEIQHFSKCVLIMPHHGNCSRWHETQPSERLGNKGELMLIFFRLYGGLCYLLGLASLIAFMLFANNGFVDVGFWLDMPILGAFAIDLPTVSLPAPPLLVNVGLIALFGLQHSVMARAGFKKTLTKFLPAVLERSTYILATAVFLGVIILFWQPMIGMVWQVTDPLLRGVITFMFWFGWVVSVLATQMIDGFHLFGLRQSFNPDQPESTTKHFTTPAFYKFVRHPIQTGVIIAMLASPDMSVGRAVLAISVIAYVFVGLFYEERDLIKEFGDTYRDYKARVPGLLPFLKIKSKQP